MNQYVATMTFYCLLTGVMSVVYADSGINQEAQVSAVQPDATNSLGVEYEKLLRMMEKKKAPVQSFDGALDVVGRPGIGSKDSNVILVEFSDFQCPFCKQHQLGAAQQIHEKLVSTGRLRYVFLDFPMEAKHPLASQAAAAARCAEEQGKYWEMRSTMYNNQKALHEMFLEGHAKTAGLDEKAFSKCLQSGQYDTAIQQDQIIGRSLGIKGTPTFFLGINSGDEIKLTRKIQGAQPYNVFEREILYAVDIAKSK